MLIVFVPSGSCATVVVPLPSPSMTSQDDDGVLDEMESTVEPLMTIEPGDEL